MENGTFWANLTNTLLGAGQNYFSQQQNNQTNISLANINANTISSVVKFVAIIVVVGGIVRALFFRRR